MPLSSTTESINRDLLTLYNGFLPLINEGIQKCIDQGGWLPEDISQPFFMHVEKEYVNAKTKILFVGRETYGWFKYNKQSNADDLMNHYKQISLNEKHFNSPFWWFREQLSQSLGIDEKFMKATLWTNLSKIDVNKATPIGPGFGDLQQYFIELLVAEIALVKPDIILILTTNGHYNWHINNYSWIENEVFNPLREKKGLVRKQIPGCKIDHLIADGRLPEHTYQLCHPNALRRKVGGYKKNADEIIRILSSSIAS